AWLESAPMATPATLAPPQSWPPAGGRRIVFLLDASSRLERRLLERWIERARPEGTAAAAYDVVAIPPSRRRRRAGRVDPRLPAEQDGVRPARLAQLLTLGDPRDPGRLRQARVLRRHPHRCCIVAGEPAPASELRERWRRAGGADVAHTAGLPDFVARQAALA